MDIDPLADTIPPRHAIESDEEDEYNPLAFTQSQAVNMEINVTIAGDFFPESSLVIASGDAGNFWAKGARLGEQVGAVMVNDVQVGLVFKPSWTKATVLISEVITKLPTWAMHRYAKTVIAKICPSTVALLDVYPIPSYISLNAGDPPIRYLSSSTSIMSPDIVRFSAPNLLQTTSASFISILSLPDPTLHKCTLLLLPSPTIQSPPPEKILSRNILNVIENQFAWPLDTIRLVHESLFASIGEQQSSTLWVYGGRVDRVNKLSSGLYKNSMEDQVGEGSIYI